MGCKVKRATCGFLLLELLVALSLIGTLTVMMGGIYMQTIALQKSAYNLIKAVELATYTINQYSVNSTQTLSTFGVFTSELEIIKDASQKICWLICTVSWKEHEKIKKIQLKKGVL